MLQCNSKTWPGVPGSTTKEVLKKSTRQRAGLSHLFTNHTLPLAATLTNRNDVCVAYRPITFVLRSFLKTLAVAEVLNKKRRSFLRCFLHNDAGNLMFMFSQGDGHEH